MSTIDYSLISEADLIELITALKKINTGDTKKYLNKIFMGIVFIGKHIECIKLLLQDMHINPTANDNCAIRRAAANGHIEVVHPFWLRSCYVSKDPFFANGLASINLYIGNHKGAWGGFSNIEGIRSNPAGHFHDARRTAEKNRGRRLSVAEVSAYWQGKVYEFIRDDRPAFLRLLREKARLVLTFYELNDYGYFQKLSPAGITAGHTAALAPWHEQRSLFFTAVL